MDTTEQLKTKFFLNALWRGGVFGCVWKSWGPARSCSYWQPVDGARVLPSAEVGVNVYFGVNAVYTIPETNSRGEMRPAAFVKPQLAVLAWCNALYGDYDAKDFGSKAAALAHIDGLPFSPSVVVDSGGGYHAYWLLSEPLWLGEDGIARARALQARWVAYVGSDGGAKDLARVLRLPGYANYKPAYAPDYPLVGYVRYDLAIQYRAETLEAALPQPQPQPQPERVVIAAAASTEDKDQAAYDAWRRDAARHLMEIIERMVARLGVGERHTGICRAAMTAGGYAAAGWGTVPEWERILLAAVGTRADAQECMTSGVGAERAIHDGVSAGYARSLPPRGLPPMPEAARRYARRMRMG